MGKRARQRKSTKRIWTKEEDLSLKKCVQIYGTDGKWLSVAKAIQGEGRNAKQCRERWLNQLDPDLKRGAWTEDEDQKLVSLQAKYGNRWAKIASFLDGRAENAVKNRWHSSIKNGISRGQREQELALPTFSSRRRKPRRRASPPSAAVAVPISDPASALEPLPSPAGSLGPLGLIDYGTQPTLCSTVCEDLPSVSDLAFSPTLTDLFSCQGTGNAPGRCTSAMDEPRPSSITPNSALFSSKIASDAACLTFDSHNALPPSPFLRPTATRPSDECPPVAGKVDGPVGSNSPANAPLNETPLHVAEPGKLEVIPTIHI